MSPSRDAWSVRWDVKRQMFRLILTRVTAIKADRWILINGRDWKGAFLRHGGAGTQRVLASL
ncbi:hypothetical protein L195_g043346 [Trifolium pratense]|uniref:Uncharacterized protein n=1 Tax=Trifolium pratense TaxID=57577 RepID=A0A2K3M919_TRIPR|nr:hypothetical protein L195_g043346 [Trifolium pratense]